MMRTFAELQKSRLTAMKSDRTRAGILALLINETRLIAKSDGNRDTTDADIISAATRMVKRNRETMSFLPEDSAQRVTLEQENAIVSEFLPTQLSEEDLKSEIEKALDGSARDKKAMGLVMRHLSENFRGQFDPAKAKSLVDAAIA